LLLPLLPPLSP
nr:Chain C, Insulin-like growth factor-binding protein-like 1 peptide [Homo sapiens]